MPGLLAVAAIWLLARPAQAPEPVTDTAGDTARIVAAQRNFRAVLIAPGALAAIVARAVAFIGLLGLAATSRLLSEPPGRALRRL